MKVVKTHFRCKFSTCVKLISYDNIFYFVLNKDNDYKQIHFYAFINICFLSLCEKALRFILIIFLKYICTQLKKKLVCSSCPRKVVLSKCSIFMNLISIVNIFWQRLIAGKMIHTSSFLRWCRLKWLFNECICLL